MPSPNDRDSAFSRLASTTFDLLVIGGGVTGCGIARDAALRGFDVALVEKEDLGAGTSSKSSKLIHGGLRYLEHAQFKLVFEGTNERALLRKRAPHLVRPLPFLVPAYRTSRPGLMKLDVGLWIYDGLSRFSSPKLHKTYRAPKIHELEPSLRTDDLKGGIVYYDCVTDDARVTLESALDARALGAAVVNHTRAVSLLRDGERVIGAEVEDVEPTVARRQVRVRARVVVNATGPWSDRVRALVGEAPILRPTKGVHLVLDAARLPLAHAVVMQGRHDRRVMFAIPWVEGRTVLGTTDTDFHGDIDRVYAERSDVEYLLETANHYFPSTKLVPEDVLATWAGLRPLVAPSQNSGSESDTSREHSIIDRPGFITIAGGKLTTFRRMAAEVVDHAGAQLGRIPISTTGERPLPGAVGVEGDADLGRLAGEVGALGLPEPVARQLADTFGARAPTVARRAVEDRGAAAPLDGEAPVIMAQVDEAVEVEMARTLCDVLCRRVPLILRARDQGLEIAPTVAKRMAARLGWSDERVADEIGRYRRAVDDSRRFRSE